jgi:hypothetical protein
MARPIDEQVQSVRDKIQELQNKEKRLINQQREADRKARTKRLIERGAIMESILPNSIPLTNDQFKALVEEMVASKPTAITLTNAIPQNTKPEEAG